MIFTRVTNPSRRRRRYDPTAKLAILPGYDPEAKHAVSVHEKHVQAQYVQRPYDYTGPIGAADVVAETAEQAARIIEDRVNDGTSGGLYAYAGAGGLYAGVYVLDMPVCGDPRQGVASALPAFLAVNPDNHLPDPRYTVEYEIGAYPRTSHAQLYRKLDSRRESAFKAAATRKDNVRKAEVKESALQMLAAHIAAYYAACVNTCHDSEFTVTLVRTIGHTSIVTMDQRIQEFTIPALKQCRLLKPCDLQLYRLQGMLGATGWGYIEDREFVKRWHRRLKADIARVGTKEEKHEQERSAL